MVTFGQLMAFIRTHFPSDVAKNGSIVKQLIRKWGIDEVEVMVKGAALLKWQDLRAINSADGVGRRWAQAAYWQSQNARGHAPKMPERVREILKAL